MPSGTRAICECGFRGWYRPRLTVRVDCERGRIDWDQAGLEYRRDGVVVKEPIQEVSTYHRQLDAFARRTRGEASFGPTPEDSIAVARLLDAMYTSAGLALRQSLESQ
jgi:predicted dehydrogenase